MQSDLKSNTPFKQELRKNIRAYIKRAKSEGTVGMSIDNLRQCTKTPSSGLSGAPKGTNAQYCYTQLFHEICREPEFKNFVICQ
jgi:hypothetical protein